MLRIPRLPGLTRKALRKRTSPPPPPSSPPAPQRAEKRPESRRNRSLGRSLLRWSGRLALMMIGAAGGVLTFHFLIMPLFVRMGQETTVPDFKGLPAATVNQLLQEALLQPGRISQAIDEQIPAGRVMRQNPPADMQVKQNREIDLVISLGPKDARVPEIEGESIVHARYLLARERIAVGNVCRVTSLSVPRDHIVATAPPVNSQMAGRRSVDLLVSDGRPRQRFLMPDFSGMDAGGVERMLQEKGFNVRRRLWPGVRGQSELVVEQTPPPGYPIEKDGTVEIVVGS
jgi:eukaryotic-like serine/threonine-protein kinase